MKTLTDKTLIPTGLAVLVIGGGSWWLSALYSDVQLIKTQIAEVKMDLKALIKRKEVAEVKELHTQQRVCILGETPPNYKDRI